LEISSAYALDIFSGMIIFISRLSRSAERSKRIFTKKGYKGKMQFPITTPSCEKVAQKRPQAFLSHKSNKTYFLKQWPKRTRRPF